MSDLQWMNFQGVLVPVSASAGPRQNPLVGAPSGFADTPTGAVMAAVHIALRLDDRFGPQVFRPTGALGVLVPSLLIRVGDTFSTWVITRAAHASDIGGRLALLMGLGDGVPAGVVVVLGLIAVLASFVQAVLMMFRQASVLILTGCLLLAASGQFGRPSRTAGAG